MEINLETKGKNVNLSLILEKEHLVAKRRN
jgi:hypothetical protein